MTQAHALTKAIIDMVPSTFSLSDSSLLMYEAEKLAGGDYATANELKRLRKLILSINDSNTYAWPKAITFDPSASPVKVDSMSLALQEFRGYLDANS